MQKHIVPGQSGYIWDGCDVQLLLQVISAHRSFVGLLAVGIMGDVACAFPRRWRADFFCEVSERAILSHGAQTLFGDTLPLKFDIVLAAVHVFSDRQKEECVPELSVLGPLGFPA